MFAPFFLTVFWTTMGALRGETIAEIKSSYREVKEWLFMWYQNGNTYRCCFLQINLYLVKPNSSCDSIHVNSLLKICRTCTRSVLTPTWQHVKFYFLPVFWRYLSHAISYIINRYFHHEILAVHLPPQPSPRVQSCWEIFRLLKPELLHYSIDRRSPPKVCHKSPFVAVRPRKAQIDFVAAISFSPDFLTHPPPWWSLR